MLSLDASERAYAAIQEKIARGEPFLIAPQGSSMFPFLIAGRDKVLLSPIPSQKRPRRGDIVLYRREEGLLVLHRMHHRNREGYYFTGDNQTELEGPLDRGQLLGIVTRIYRQGKDFSPRRPAFWIVGRLWLRLRPFRSVLSRSVKKILKAFHLYKESGNKST